MMTGWGELAFGSWIWMVVWIAALLVMVWLIVAGGRDRSSHDDPLEILRARYARGEINQEEFERARQSLLESHQGGTRT